MHGWRPCAPPRQPRLQDAFGERGGTFQAVTERDIRVRNSLSRLEQLEIGRESLVFGRIDRSARPMRPADQRRRGRPDRGVPHRPAGHLGPGPGAPGRRLAGAGRRALLPGHGRPPHGPGPPAALPHRGPAGAGPRGRAVRCRGQRARRRARACRVRRCCSPPWSGPAPAACATSWPPSSASRTRSSAAPCRGSWSSRAARAPGKTAVALHRAAYLLYTYRFPLESQGVLVVGPNPTFLRYIEHVLPSLDESGVELSTVNGLFSGTRPAGREDEDTARLKGTPGWPASSPGPWPTGSARCAGPWRSPSGPRLLRITPALSAQVVAAAKRRAGTHNARRRTVEAPAVAAPARADSRPRATDPLDRRRPANR